VVNEIVDTMNDKVKMKNIKVATKVLGFQSDEKALVKTDQKRL